MDPSTYRGLTFLLSLGALPIACNPEKNDTTDGGTGGTTTGATTTGATTDATGGESSGDLVTDSGPTGGTSGVTTSGSTGAGETTGGAGDTCDALVAFQVMCDPSLAGMEADLLAECQDQRKVTKIARGDACLAMLDAAFECVVMSTCDTVGMCEALSESAAYCLPEPGMACKAYAAKFVECMPGEDPTKVGGYCQSGLNYSVYLYGPTCGTATEELYACLGGLSCGDLLMGIGCDAESMAADAACK